MSGAWSKLKKSLSFKSSGGSGSSSQLPPRVPTQSDCRSTVPRCPSSDTSSSLSSRFSLGLSSSGRSSKKTCAICLGNVRTGQGHAIFTAECSHSFHFSCIADSVKHGNYLCPICRSKWKEIPFQLPSVSADANRNAQVLRQPIPTRPERFHYTANEPLRYSDDELLPVISTDPTVPASYAPSNNVSVKAFTEFPAVAAPESVSDFAVLVRLRAPPLLNDARQGDRAPIDLVTVLDVSGSMAGSKLLLLKRAVGFVIDNLGHADRLSIVSFSSSADRIFPLRRMTDGGREDARLAVNSLFADGETDIVQGLKKAVQVLEERRERNPVASIILLSDGKDNFSFRRAHHNRTSSNPTEVPNYTDLLPVSICPNISGPPNEDSLPTFQVHTFGFGSDHDSFAMHAISDVSGGTFSFIESIGMVQDAFARCIGGLLSVVAQELRLTVTSTSPGVEIGSIPSGRYLREISDQGHQGVINVGDLYADEEKEFLIHLSVPMCPISEDEEGVKKTSLVKIACSYRDAASKATVELEGERVEIRRPEVLSPTDATLSLEVDRQRNRLWVAEAIAQAQEMAELGNLEGAQALLTNRRSNLLSSASAQAGDILCNRLEAELTEIRERMANMQMYEHTGRAYVLSGLSSHSWQRATTRGNSTGGSSSNTGSVGYDTPSMVSMISKSQVLTTLYPREQVTRQNWTTSM